MTVGRGRSFGDQEIKNILKVLNNTEFKPHKRGKYTEARWWGNEEVKNGFGEYLHWYLTTMTYPYDVPIKGCWSHLYKSRSGMMGMHQDKYADISSPDGKYWVTTCLVEKSPDLIGGEIVLAGDSYEDYEVFQSRLKVINLTEIGQTAVWNGETVHGVSEITNGHRWVFVVYKEVE
tara:strand:- start:197 stop:724 length:528 start_codon:yes stop_codon:yes gene_type:complete